MNKMRANLPLVIVVGLLLALLAGKALAVMVSGAAVRTVALDRRSLQQAGMPLSPDQLETELRPLERGLFWSPCDAETWCHYARNLHRLAMSDRETHGDTLARLQKKWGLGADMDQRETLLRAAMFAYDEAIRHNALITGAHLWRIAAKVALDGANPENWRRELRAAVADALRYDPQDPALWRAAGDLAVRHGDPDTAAQWYRQSLTYRLDGLAQVADKLLLDPEGSGRLAEAVPETAPALRELARYYYARWRLAEAYQIFARALALEGIEPLAPSPGQALLDGDFSQSQDRLLYAWQTERAQGVSVKRVREEEDESFLSVRFRHGPDNWYHVYQQAPVIAGQRYRLSARVRSEGFSPATQLGVEVVHPYEASLYAASDARCRARRGSGSVADKSLPVCGERFTLIETELTIPDGLWMVKVRLRMLDKGKKGAGRADFTDISLRQVADEGGEN